MNVETGAMIELPDGKSIPGYVRLTDYETGVLKKFPEDMRPFELAWLRHARFLKAQNNRLDHFEIQKRKEAFRHGWNAAIHLKSKTYVLTPEEAAEIDAIRASTEAQAGAPDA